MKKSKVNIMALKPLTKKYHLPAAKAAQKMVKTAIKVDGIATLMIGIGAASCATLISIGSSNKKFKETKESMENLGEATATQIGEVSKAHNKLAKKVKSMDEEIGTVRKYEKRIKALELQIKNRPVQNMDPALIAQRFKQNESALGEMANRLSSLEDAIEEVDEKVAYNKKVLDKYADATADRFEKIESEIQDMKENPVVVADGESVVLHDPKMDIFMEEQKKQMKTFTDTVKKIVNEMAAKTSAMEEKLKVVDELMDSVDSVRKDAITEAKKEAAANYNGVKKLISEVDNRLHELEENDTDSLTGIGPFKEAVSALKADHVSKKEFQQFRDVFDKILKLDIPSLSQFINRKTKEYDETLHKITDQISGIQTVEGSSVDSTELENLKTEVEKLKETNPTTEIVEKLSTIVTNTINNPNQPIVKSLNACIQTLELHKNAIIEIQEIIEQIDESVLSDDKKDEQKIVDSEGNAVRMRDIQNSIENLDSGFDLFYDTLMKVIENSMHLLAAVEGGDKNRMISVYEEYESLRKKLTEDDNEDFEEDPIEYESIWKDGADEEDEEEEEDSESSKVEEKPVSSDPHVIIGGPLFLEDDSELSELEAPKTPGPILLKEESEKESNFDAEQRKMEQSSNAVYGSSGLTVNISSDIIGDGLVISESAAEKLIDDTTDTAEEPEEDLHDPKNVDDFTMIYDYKHMSENEFLKKYGEVNYDRAKEMMRLAMEDAEYEDMEDNEEEEDEYQEAIKDGNDLLRELNELDDEIEEEDDSIFTQGALTDEEIQEYIDAGIVDPFTYEVNEYKLRVHMEEKIKKEAAEKKVNWGSDELDDIEKDAPENKNCGFEDDEDKYKYYTDEEREEYRKKAENFDPEKETSIFDGIVSDEYREAFMEERKKHYEEIAETGKSEKINVGAMKNMMKEGTEKIIESQIPRETHLKDRKDLEKLNEYYQALVHLSMSVHYLARETLHKQDDWVPDYFKKEVTEFMINACDVDPDASWKKITLAVRQAWITAKNEFGFDPEDMERDPNNDLIDEVYEHYNLGVSTNQPGAGAAPSGMNRAQRRAAAKAKKKKGKRR